MNDPAFPADLASIDAWAQEAGVTVTEARVRFAQFAVLSAIGTVTPLRQALVFKGGNALDFLWHPNRSTTDLDFSLLAPEGPNDLVPDRMHALFQRGLDVVRGRTGFLGRVHSVRQRPPGEHRTFPTFEVRVGYALADQAALMTRMAAGRESPQVIPVEISVNDVVCAFEELGPEASFPHIRVCTVEDIVAEKLRSLLQQPVRNRFRRQDVLDVASVLASEAPLDIAQVSAFLVAKSVNRNITVSRTAFCDADLRIRSSRDYEGLEVTTRRQFIAFDDAWELIDGFIDRLDIPD